MVGVGLVGLGEVGQVHLAGLRESTHARPVVICDLGVDLPERSRGDERVAVSFDELLADVDVEVVDICLPHHLHAPYVLQALAAGRHVLLEKPMAMSVAECDLILASAAAAGRGWECRTINCSTSRTACSPECWRAAISATCGRSGLGLPSAASTVGGGRTRLRRAAVFSWMPGCTVSMCSRPLVG